MIKVGIFKKLGYTDLSKSWDNSVEKCRFPFLCMPLGMQPLIGRIPTACRWLWRNAFLPTLHP